MSVARKVELVTEEDYLAGELLSEVKHEYVGGFVYAMSGGRNVHNRIATRALVVLGGLLEEGTCEPYNSDTKIRIRFPDHTKYYYPDVSVVCRSNPPEDLYQDEPVLLVEVLSGTTRRLDFGEKKDAYLSLPCLDVYLLVETKKPSIVVYRRNGDVFESETWEGLDATIPLPSLRISLPLKDIYRGVVFPGET